MRHKCTRRRLGIWWQCLVNALIRQFGRRIFFVSCDQNPQIGPQISQARNQFADNAAIRRARSMQPDQLPRRAFGPIDCRAGRSGISGQKWPQSVVNGERNIHQTAELIAQNFGR